MQILFSSSQEKKKRKKKPKTNPPKPTLTEVKGMFAGAKTAKDLGTGEMQVKMQLAKWQFRGLWYIYIYFMGIFLYILYNIPYVKARFNFLQTKIIRRRETTDRIQRGYLGFLYRTYLYSGQILV